MGRRHHPLVALILVLLAASPVAAGPRSATSASDVRVNWMPKALRSGAVSLMVVHPVTDAATVEGSFGDRPLVFFPYADGVAALVGLDLEARRGRHPWKVAVVDGARPPRTLSGFAAVEGRQFPIQRLTLPPGQVDLDAETAGRVEVETQRLRSLYRTVTPDRLWRGPFVTPVSGVGPGEGFGARRIINGQPRSPHVGADYAAERGTAVVASNFGQVALVGDFFFPGRFVAIDHGLGLYTLYFHLDRALVSEGERVDRGQPIGAVGATGRATGSHLHFGVQIGSARIDPEALLSLKID